ncbi:MAG TPA: P1 family peptidase [Thermoplasmata archaeon]|nr:P1 family peptidase [Thermoplasmata archaeon]
MPAPERGSTLTRVPGVKVGHSESSDGATGVTAVLFDAGAPTVVDVRGGASGTYDTASLALDATFGRRWALFLAGGSLYGLDAARGVRRRILETGGGVPAFQRAARIVPISGAILFDLPSDERRIPDYDPIGYRAASNASRAAVRPGRVGAGAGATLGKYLGRSHASPGGIGSAATKVGSLGWVGALVVLNSVGAVRDPETGTWISGARGEDGAILPPSDGGLPDRPTKERGTTLIVIATDAPVGRPVLQRVAIYAHDGLARAIVPAHTATDGDLVFVSATREATPPRQERFPGESADRLGAAASAMVVRAALGAARAARR